MQDTTQPVAGSLSAVITRACRESACPNRGRADCAEHARTEDLGEIASFDYREAANAQKQRR